MKENTDEKSLVRINENSIFYKIKQLKLQKQYRSGQIKEEEQVNSLCALYDKQIANLRKSNEIRKQKLLEYRRKLQTDN